MGRMLGTEETMLYCASSAPSLHWLPELTAGRERGHLLGHPLSRLPPVHTAHTSASPRSTHGPAPGTHRSPHPQPEGQHGQQRSRSTPKTQLCPITLTCTLPGTAQHPQ